MNDAEKVKQIQNVISEWDGKQGHDRCWYYPDLFERIANIVGVQLNNAPVLPTRSEFEEGCRRFQNQEFQNVDGAD